MSDKKPSRPASEGAAPAPDPSSLKGLTMALGIEPAKPGHDPLLGCDIGGVRIVRLIAEGGMGRVYEGKQEKPNRTVAVKVMRPGLTSPSILKRFEYEAEVLGRLQHPGIAHIYSVGVHRMGNATVPYFVMEYIADARTLTKYANDLRLPTRQRLDLFRSVCDAVAHGHQKGVIHRDLKPSNILVDAAGQPKVIDFGVARATDSDMALTTMQTDVGQLIGTLQYMSPEQFKADPNDIDVRSDVYALGVILYELLAGKMPYDVKKKAIHEVARIVQEDDPKPLSSFNRALKGDVAVIAGKCLEKDRVRRYSSASELGSDVGRYLSGEAISASPPGFVDGLIRLARKHRAAALAVTCVFATLVLAVVGISVFASRASRDRRIAIEQRDEAENAKAIASQERERATLEAENANQQLYIANVYRVMSLITQNAPLAADKLLKDLIHSRNNRSLPIELSLATADIDTSTYVLEGHQANLSHISYSPDGKVIATAGADGVRLRDAVSQRTLVATGSTASAVHAMVFSPDSRFLGIALVDDPTAQVWHVLSGSCVANLRGHTKYVEALAFSPAGDRLATTSEDNTARLWKTDTWEPVTVLKGHPSRVTGVCFSPDSRHVVTVSAGSMPHMWNAATGEKVSVYKGAIDNFNKAAYSPAGDLVATPGGQRNVYLWDPENGRQLAVLKGHTFSRGMADINAIAFAADGRLLASVSTDRTVRLWDTKTATELAVCRGHADGVDGLRFRPSRKELATWSKDNTVRLWDTESGQIVRVMTCPKPRDAAFSPDGKTLAVACGDGLARGWVLDDYAEPTRFDRGPSVSECVAFNHDGSWLAFSAHPNQVRVIDIETCTDVALLKHDATVSGLEFDRAGTSLAAITKHGIYVWNMLSGTIARVLPSDAGKSPGLRRMAFSPDGASVLASSLKGLELWSVDQGRKVAVYEQVMQTGHTASRHYFRFLGDGDRFVAVGKRGPYKADRLRIYDSKTGDEIISCDAIANPGAINSLSSNATGTRAIISQFSQSQPSGVWDLERGSLVSSCAAKCNAIDSVFSPDDSKVATADIGGNADGALIWDASTGEVMARIQGHSGGVTTLRFNHQGDRLVTASVDATARIWDVDTGAELAGLKGHTAGVWWADFSPDGKRVATASEDGTVRLWGMSNQSVYAARQDSAARDARLGPTVESWRRAGTDAAVERLLAARKEVAAEDFRAARNMLLRQTVADAAYGKVGALSEKDPNGKAERQPLRADKPLLTPAVAYPCGREIAPQASWHPDIRNLYDPLNRDEALKRLVAASPFFGPDEVRGAVHYVLVSPAKKDGAMVVVLCGPWGAPPPLVPEDPRPYGHLFIFRSDGTRVRYSANSIEQGDLIADIVGDGTAQLCQRIGVGGKTQGTEIWLYGLTEEITQGRPQMVAFYAGEIKTLGLRKDGSQRIIDVFGEDDQSIGSLAYGDGKWASESKALRVTVGGKKMR